MLHAFYADNKMTFLTFILMPVFFLLSCLYLFILAVIKLLYRFHILRSYRFKGCVISVGNITMGGSGKTPLVHYLADYLSRYRRVLILLRGYRRPKKPASVGKDTFYKFGDEASMLMDVFEGGRCQVIAERNRTRSLKSMEEKGFNGIVILDDGFQHWRVMRDFDIVVIDAAKPFGNRMVLPAGQLREDLGALKRADCICLSRCNEVSPDKLADLKDYLLQKAESAIFIETIHQNIALKSLKNTDLVELEYLKGKKVCLFCGIANPYSFLASVERLGAQVVEKRFFSDHHEYSKEEARCLVRMCMDAKASVLITTEKDAQRLAGFFAGTDTGIEVFALKIAIKVIEGEEVLHERLNALCAV